MDSGRYINSTALLRTTTIQTKAFLPAPCDPLYNAALTTLSFAIISHNFFTSWEQAELLCIMKMMCFKDISMQQSSGRNIKYFAGRLFIMYNFTWRENPLIDNEFALSWFFLMFFVSIDRKHIKNLNLGHQGA